MNDNGIWNFDDLPERVQQITYKGRSYELHCATEEASIKYTSQTFRGAQFGADNKLRPGEGAAEADVVLVAHCLYYAEGKEKDRLVSVSILKGWPHEAVEKMAEWVKDNTPGMRTDTRERLEEEIAKLQARLAKLDGPGAEDEAKNSYAATEDISG